MLVPPIAFGACGERRFLRRNTRLFSREHQSTGLTALAIGLRYQPDGSAALWAQEATNS